ncbi:4'-phosphopantetheinyl transferase superfamily protein [uncultured Aquimarina sp.]|uniref:4'-phosphopantetheinyl transferase family protein n=1 Tax=uncultured Aquimarina sp. TaxID=575652 RepID=UPI00262DA370|nr:4'-phosphopantetheinyl transferase superfamily protein [uncultured Aquimarina sp.]
MTIILYTHFEKNTSYIPFQDLLKSLPTDIQKRIKEFRAQCDAEASLYGKLLLQKGFLKFGINSSLEDLKYTKYNKPYLKNARICFNISHSANYVICAISSKANYLGVDIEKIKEIDYNDFQKVWSRKESELIQKNGLNSFYDYWTRKEAIIKADGRGLEIPLEKIDVRDSKVILDKKLFYLKKIDLDKNYSLHLASDITLDKIDLIQLHF